MTCFVQNFLDFEKSDVSFSVFAEICMYNAEKFTSDFWLCIKLYSEHSASGHSRIYFTCIGFACLYKVDLNIFYSDEMDWAWH